MPKRRLVDEDDVKERVVLTERLDVRISKEEMRQVRELAALERRTVSNWIRHVIDVKHQALRKKRAGLG